MSIFDLNTISEDSHIFNKYISKCKPIYFLLTHIQDDVFLLMEFEQPSILKPCFERANILTVRLCFA